MDKIIGNFLTQDDKSFPLDCETLSYLDENRAMCEMLGNIAGDKSILSGCKLNANGTERSEGYVFLKTTDFPEGEILHWVGGAIANGMYLKKTDISVSVSSSSYPKAYTKRSLAPGSGDENYSWDGFVDVGKVKTEPLGIVKMFAGTNVPEGYHLCDGSALSKTTYSELFAAIGNTFNTAPDQNGNTQAAPSSSEFRLPDLRGRFIVGQSNSITDYTTKGKAGGAKAVTLQESDTPPHTHDMKDIFFAEGHDLTLGNAASGKFGMRNGVLTDNAVGDGQTISKGIGSNDTDQDNDTFPYITHKTEYNRNSATAHENRPPYYVLAYIMKLK